MKTILVPVDFSGVSKAVAKEATSLALATNSRIVLLNVVQPPVITTEYSAAMANMQEIAAASEKAAARQLASFKAQFVRESVEVETVQKIGAPVVHILAQAKKLEAAYIVMGTHGHGAIYNLLVGSTTSGVLKKSPCPVVVIPKIRKTTAKKRQAQ